MIYTIESVFTLSRGYPLLHPQIILIWTGLNLKALWGPKRLLKLARPWD